jgi:hypothetical protein
MLCRGCGLWSRAERNGVGVFGVIFEWRLAFCKIIFFGVLHFSKKDWRSQVSHDVVVEPLHLPPAYPKLGLTRLSYAALLSPPHSCAPLLV